MSSMDAVFRNRTEFINIPKQVYSDEFLAKELQIPIDCITFYDCWTFINNDWLYYKKIKNIKMLIDELLGVELAKFYDKRTIEYIIGKKIITAEETYYLLSKNFRKKNCQYLLSNEIGIPNFVDFDVSLNNLENLRMVCSSDEEYRNLLWDIFKMLAIDFYSTQNDRNFGNMLFEVKKCGHPILLSPMYDYEYSFENAYSTQIVNPLYCSDVFSDNTAILFRDHYEFYFLIKKILAFDMESALKKIIADNNLVIPSEVMASYVDYDKNRKHVIKHI